MGAAEALLAGAVCGGALGLLPDEMPFQIQGCLAEARPTLGYIPQPTSGLKRQHSEDENRP